MSDAARSGVCVRPFGGLDLDRAASLHALCFPAAWDQPWDRQGFAEIMAMPGTFGLLAEEAARILGLIVVRVAVDEAEVLTVGVQPDLRRTGIGGTLFAAAQGEARTRGATRLHLEVAEDNFAARKLYAGLGFDTVGRRPGYYRRGPLGAVAAVLMARAL